MVLCFLRKGSLQEATTSPVLSDSGLKHLGELSGARIGLPISAYTPKTCPNYFFFFFCLLLLLLLFLGPLPRHMEVPRLGVESEL